MGPRDEALECTRLLRSSNEPRWERLRSHLREEGVEPPDAAIGTLFQDDVRMEFGILVTRDGRAFRFTFDFLRDREGNEVESLADAWVQLWEELNERQRTFTYSKEVAAATQVLRQGADE